jgi:dTDP-4-amino-4,6-dideoxygalactose transaminase
MAVINPRLARTQRPARTEYLPFHVPAVGDEEIRAVTDTLRSGWLTTGPRVKQFEADFAAFVGARHAVALNSATAALHLSLEALGVGAGDEVIVPTMTFTATGEVVVHLNARPVLVDCQPDTMNVDPDAIERAITPRTKAIVPVHLAGLPCDMTRIAAIADRHHLPIVEDAAHSLPASYGGVSVGRISELTCFSFYATKTITTGEGGMVTTDNDEHAARIRLMSLHGISHDGWKRYTAAGSWFYEVHEAGYKDNMTDLAAALGIEQLKKAAAFREARARIAARYDAAFSTLPELSRPARSDDSEHAWHLYVIRLDLERLTIDRARFIDALKQRHIGTSVHFIPLHLHPYYQRTLGADPAQFPVASAAYERIVSLPIFPTMTDDDVEDVVEAVRVTIEQHRR